MSSELPEKYQIPDCFEPYLETPYKELEKMTFTKELFYRALDVEHLLYHFKEPISRVQFTFDYDKKGMIWKVRIKAFNKVGYPLFFDTSSKFSLHAAVFSACVLLYKKQRKDGDDDKKRIGREN